MTTYYVYEDSSEFLSLWKTDSNGVWHRYYEEIEEWNPCIDAIFKVGQRAEISEKDAFFFIITGGVSTNLELLFNNEKRRCNTKHSE